jgi:hypothetical protein
MAPDARHPVSKPGSTKGQGWRKALGLRSRSVVESFIIWPVECNTFLMRAKDSMGELSAASWRSGVSFVCPVFGPCPNRAPIY